MKKRPFIGISANVMTIESGSYLGYERSVLVQEYIRAIETARGIPIVLPVVADRKVAIRQLQHVDGLLLSGGYDVSPFFYENEPRKELGITNVVRDQHEIVLIKTAIRLKKPIFGICRGMQILNVALKGELYQDIPAECPDAIQHYQKANPDFISHLVSILPKTKLRTILGKDCLFANSFHHQAVKKLAPGLVINAVTSDNIIEGIEMDSEQFVVGVQWHPEFLCFHMLDMMKLFDAFVDAARNK